MKRIFLWLAALTLLLPLRAEAVSTHASSAILMDADSGRILYQQDIHQQRLIASITKLMTALVAVEQSGDPEELVAIKPEWTGVEGSSIYLQAGEQISLRALLYGMLLQSGNDAALATACHIAGDEAAFVELMNEKAARLGMKNTCFANASGLNHEAHYSTAHDMALLACACLENETVADICATRSITIGTRTFVNHNKLLWRYKDCVGMKTGYTERAGRTLISAACRNGQTLVCVTLNDGDDWNDHETLLDHGFSQYPRQTLCEQGQRFGVIPVSGSLIPVLEVQAAEAVGYPLAEQETLTLEVDMAECLEAPVMAGICAGKAVWSLNGTPVAETELICAVGAGRDVCSPRTLRDRFLDVFTA